MRLETFFEKFELFAEAPGAVGKMRELILQLAAHGELIKQVPDDEPASKLLSRIEGHFESLRKRRELRGSPVEPLDRQSLPDIPPSWEWVPLGNVVDYGTSDKSESANIPDDAWLLDLEDIEKDTSRLLQRKTFRNSPSKSTKTAFMAGDVLYGKLRPYLNKVLVADAPGYCTTEIIPIRTFGFIEPAYLCYALKRPEFLAYANAKSYGMNLPRLGTEDARRAAFPLPPLAEQKRIVAKVDELMALCDRLETQQQERDIRHAALARASLARFAEAPTPANLDFLFHPSYPITPADLRKTILTLAVQGKLVPQVPNDESAEACLSRLGLKSTLAPLDGADDGEDLLPPSWTWVRFEDIALVAGGVTLGRKLGARKTVSLPYLRVANVKRGEIDLGVIKEIPIAEDEIERYALRENDLLMTEGGDWDKVGRAAIWRAQIPLCLHQNHVFRARMRSAEIAPEWFERYFNSPDGRGYFESAAKQTTNLASINMRQVRGCPVPLPPLAEQRRIVAKVDQLMALVDQLEAHLSQAKAKSAALLDAVIHELLNPTAEIVDLAGYRAAIGCYAIKKMQDKRYFGRTAAMKVLYLAQAHVGLELGFQPWRDAAGPLDSWIYRFEDVGQNRDWFKVDEGTTFGGNKKIEYRPGRMLAEQTALAERQLSASQRKELDRLLTLFADKTTEEAEIIATLFAAWNDFLIDGHAPSDDEIVTEVRENWHVNKARFAPTLLRQWLGWLRQHNLIPQGRLPHTVHQQQLSWN